MNATTHRSSREGGIWTEPRVTRLTELWLDGVSARLIGIEMGIPKNAVVGKAHRLELPQRGSPIDYSGKSPEKKARRQAGLASATPQSETTVPLAAHESEVIVPRRRGACQFIAGEKGVDFKIYADAPRCPESARPGSPYCGAHHIRCHRTRLAWGEAA